jgi:hypothetical protein
MARQDMHHHSRTSKVRDSTSWAQDNPCAAGFQKSRDFYEAHGHHKLVTVEQYTAVLERHIDHIYAGIFDPQEFRRELRDLYTQVKTCVTGEALASSSPLLIERRAYSNTAGHAPQHRPSPKVKGNDRHKVKVAKDEQRAVGHQAPQEPMDLVTGRDNKDGENIIRGKWP